MISTKAMGWIQLIGGIIGIWASWQGGLLAFDAMAIGIAALSIVFFIMGWHHIQGKGHKIF